MRERYRMVRSREALIPVELVVQGSLRDLTFGAFPRLRPLNDARRRALSLAVSWIATTRPVDRMAGHIGYVPRAR